MTVPNSIARLRVDLGDSVVDDGLSVTIDRYGSWYETYDLPPRHAERLKRALRTANIRRKHVQFGWTSAGKDSYLEVIYEF
jgi:hypothetical protein